MKHKLLALDIDGTIVKEHTDTPTPAVIQSIQEASRYINITLVSARAWNDQKKIIDALGLPPSYQVIENGTKVINPLGIVEYTKLIPFVELDPILQTAKGLYDTSAFGINGSWKPKNTLFESSEISTISLISSSRSKAETIPSLLKSLPKHYSVSVGAHWSEPTWAVTLISHIDASKGKGLAYVQQKLDITPEETIAVGDGASDVPMMKYASLKVAMGNAEEVLKKECNYTTESVMDDGLISVINKLIFHTDLIEE